MTDPIADMLTRIRNAHAVAKNSVDVPFSKMNLAVAKLLERHGFVKNVEIQKRRARRMLEITLKYKEGRPAISGLKRISKPGVRIYKGAQELKSIKSGYGIAVLSTSKGILTNLEAKKQNVGGEVLCEIW